MKTKLFCALATVALTLSAMADDQLRNVQTELKNQGFYYGDVTGQASSEMTSAVRRYQIRNGLEVTGTLTKETLTALGMVASKPKQTAPADTAEAAPKQPGQGKASNPVNIRRDNAAEESDREFLQREEGKDRAPTPHGDFFATPPSHPTASAPPTPIAPRDPSVGAPRESSIPTPRDPGAVAPPAPLDAPSADFPVLFAGTPYATAPLSLQQNTLRRAQSVLAGRGFYRDIVDGMPGPATEEALLTFQRSARLTLTGRLDLDTLNELRLLPGNNAAGPQIGFEFRTPNHVFRGVWVQRW